MRRGRCCPTGPPSWRWPARAGSRWCRGATIRCGRAAGGPVSSSPLPPARVPAGSSWPSAGARRPTAVSPRSKSSGGPWRDSTSRSRAMSARASSTRPDCSRRRRARPRRRSPCSAGGSSQAGGLAGGLAAIGARLEPGFEVVARAAGFEDALAGVDLVVTGEGKVDMTSLDGKVVGGVLEWAAEEGVPNRAVVAGQVTPEAREEISVLGAVDVFALTDRVWQAGEAFARAGLLVEEAAIELGRKVLSEA